MASYPLEMNKLPVNNRLKNYFKNIKKLYPPQAEAIYNGINGENILVSVPTASGKSLISYILMFNTILRRGGLGIYIVPLKALASEKYLELNDIAKELNLGIKVALSVGDTKIDKNKVEYADIIISTYERLDTLIRNYKAYSKHLDVLVIDEIHNIDLMDRGSILENTITKVKYLNKQVQIIGLSATVGNSEEIAKWLDAKHIKSNFRPIPLIEGIYNIQTSRIEFRDVNSGGLFYKNVDKTKDVYAGLVIDTLKQNGQCIIFLSSRNLTQNIAKNIAENIGDSLPYTLREGYLKIANRFKDEVQDETIIGDKLYDCLKEGIAFHNAGLTSAERNFIENAFKNKEIYCICATTTLAAGINLPARRVFIGDTTRYDKETGLRKQLSVNEIKQMSGRAGRPQFDEIGEAIYIVSNSFEKDEIISRYIYGDYEKVSSKINDDKSKSFRKILIGEIATGIITNNVDLWVYIRSTFFGFQYDDEVKILNKKVNDTISYLISNGFVEIDSEIQVGNEESIVYYKPTKKGVTTSKLYVDPETIVMLDYSIDLLDKFSVFDYLINICRVPDMRGILIDAKPDEYKKYEEIFLSYKSVYQIPSNDFVEEFLFINQIKTAVIFYEFINEVPMDDLIKKYNIAGGDISVRSQSMQWIFHALIVMANIRKSPYVDIITTMSDRIKYGVKEELIPFVWLEGVGRMRARAIFDSGIVTLDIMKTKSWETLSKIEGIGKKLAKSIYNQLHRIKEEKIKVVKNVNKTFEFEDEDKQKEETEEEKNFVSPFKLVMPEQGDESKQTRFF